MSSFRRLFFSEGILFVCIVGVFSRFGGALLSHTLRCSTIGATVLNCRVRDGTGCFTCAMTTKPRKNPALERYTPCLPAANHGEQEAVSLRSKGAFLHQHVVQVSFSLIHVLPPLWATYDMVGMYALIVFHRRVLLLTVCLLLDQIKPIGQLVPVN